MRKPEDLRKPTETREALWGLMVKLGEFTEIEISSRISLDSTTINVYIRSLVKAGHLSRTETGDRRGTAGFKGRYRYKVIKGSLDAPRVRKDGTPVTQGRGRLNMWRSMKILKRFTLADIVACSSTEEHPVSWEEAETYIRYLERARYIKKMNKAPVETASYMLIRWTGNKAPMIQRVRRVWDPNLKQVTWQSDEKGGE